MGSSRLCLHNSDLDFTDDIALLAHSPQLMQDNLREGKPAKTGLCISTQKTKVLKENTKTLARLMVNQQPLGELKPFIYLSG